MSYVQLYIMSCILFLQVDIERPDVQLYIMYCILILHVDNERPELMLDYIFCIVYWIYKWTTNALM